MHQNFDVRTILRCKATFLRSQKETATSFFKKHYRLCKILCPVGACLMAIVNNKVPSKPGELIWQGIGLLTQFGKVMGSIPGQFFCW